MSAKTKNLDEQNEQFLEEYLNCDAPAGMEDEGQEKWMEYMRNHVDYNCELIDQYGNAVVTMGSDKEDAKSLVITAHADEISWRISHITDSGYIYPIRNGGTDPQVAPGQRVFVHTRNGDKIKGVFGWPAVHTRNKDTQPKKDNIFIDIGCSSKDEVQELGIGVGSIVTYQDGFEKLNDEYYMGRALDNRIGGFIISQVARLLSNSEEDIFGDELKLHIVNCVQEEVGSRGAKIISETLKPDAAIVTDVCHDTSTPLAKSEGHGDVKGGDGPSLTYAPIIHNGFLEYAEEIAKEEHISFQQRVGNAMSGTDMENFAFSNGGVPSIIMSPPCKYMHTPVEMVAREDVDETIQLMKSCVENFAEQYIPYLNHYSVENKKK